FEKSGLPSKAEYLSREWSQICRCVSIMGKSGIWISSAGQPKIGVRRLERQAEAGPVVGEIDEAAFGLRLAVEDVPEQLVADFDRHFREIFRNRAGIARHGDVIVVHLARMRDHRNV